MDDREMTRLTAEAMGYATDEQMQNQFGLLTFDRNGPLVWHPLMRGEQVTALIKRFRIFIEWYDDGSVEVYRQITPGRTHNEAGDLSRAIVECVAKMYAAEKIR